MSAISPLLFTLALLTSVSKQAVNGKDFTPIHKKGYCVWYGQCTTGPKALNCAYNGPAKNITDPEAKKIIEGLCPEFKDGPTCCDVKQLLSLWSILEVLKQFVGHCPACWDNFRRLYCTSTCSPNQSLFMDAREILIGTIVKSVSYYVSNDYKQGLFNSCKNVFFIAVRNEVLNLLCGTVVENCNPEKLLEYMGSTANGFAAFTTEYPQIIPTGRNITWMDSVIRTCDKPFLDPVTGKTARPCDCDECLARQPCLYDRLRPARPVPSRLANLTIRSTHPVKTGYRRSPDKKFIPFGPIFHMSLLNQSLELQLSLTNLEVPYDGSKITLRDVCTKSKMPRNNNCIIESLFNYFQNNITLLNKCKTMLGYDCSQLKRDFFYADFHDHIIFCSSNYPYANMDPKFKASCLGVAGQPVDPDFVLADYPPSKEFEMATTLVIYFVLDNGEEVREKTEAWKRGFMRYMESYVEDPKHSNLTITFGAGM